MNLAMVALTLYANPAMHHVSQRICMRDTPSRIGGKRGGTLAPLAIWILQPARVLIKSTLNRLFDSKYINRMHEHSTRLYLLLSRFPLPMALIHWDIC
jgi:hypothetical protein